MDNRAQNMTKYCRNPSPNRRRIYPAEEDAKHVQACDVVWRCTIVCCQCRFLGPEDCEDDVPRRLRDGREVCAEGHGNGDQRSVHQEVRRRRIKVCVVRLKHEEGLSARSAVGCERTRQPPCARVWHGGWGHDSREFREDDRRAKEESCSSGQARVLTKRLNPT